MVVLRLYPHGEGVPFCNYDVVLLLLLLLLPFYFFPFFSFFLVPKLEL